MPAGRWMSVCALLWALLPASARPAAAVAVTRPGTPFTIDRWGPEEKFPGSSVIAMVQTRDGYLWLGTLYGLVRFDGMNFKVFDESNTPELGSGRIVSLFEDREGNLWIGTETAGVVLVKDGKFTNLGLGRGSAAGRVVSMCQDAAGAVWLYTADGQLARHRGGEVDVWREGAEFASQLRAIIAEKLGLLWVGMDGQLFSFDPAKAERGKELRREQSGQGLMAFLLAGAQDGHWRRAGGRIEKWRAGQREPDVTLNWPGPDVRVGAVCEDREGNLVVGTLGAGLWWFNKSGQATNLSAKDGLGNDYVLSLLADQEGSLWVGTDGGGLNRVRRQVFEVAEPTRGWVVQAAGEDAEGGIWIGSNGHDAARWKDGVLSNFVVRGFVTRPSVRSVFVDRTGQVWAGTLRDGLFQLFNGRFQRVIAPLHPDVTAMREDHAGRLWVGTHGGVAWWGGSEWRTLGTNDGLSSAVVQALAGDAETNLWIGTVGGGLNRLRDGKFTAFRKSDGCPSDDISALFADAEGAVWVGTFGSGLGRFHKGRWTRYTTRDGLVSNSIAFIIEDGQGNLWIGSNLGLMRVARRALNEFAEGTGALLPGHIYGAEDGLPSSECSLGTAWRARDGKLWFPTIAGLASVSPAQIKPNLVRPPVAIEAVLIDGEAHGSGGLRPKWTDDITVPAGRERLEIQYTSLNLSSADRARFRYRLEGHEDSWTDVGGERTARYRKLPPGRYTFRVTACNEDGLWNETGAALAVVVEPPFWRTWWFLTASALCLLGAVTGAVHYFSTQKLQRQLAQLRQQEAVEKERARIARDIHDQVGANLTQVSLLGELVESDKDSPGDVAEHAKQISQAARETTRALDEIVWTVNPSNDTLEGLVNYICKNAQDYLAVAGLRYRLDVPSQLPATPIPPDLRHNVFLAARESVNNVIRHAQATSAWVRLRLEPGRFILEIEDNGRGLGDVSSKSHRNGLRNMRQRMAEVGGEFSIGPGAEGGTLVRLTAPLARG